MSDTNRSAASASSVLQILAAARFAAERHRTQKRKGKAGDPYVNHLLEVAELIASSSSDGVDTNLIVAALLHDTVEDTATTIHELRENFGEDVAGLVAEVTDDKSLPKATRKALQVRNAPHKSARAATLKLADKISNLRAILACPPTDWSVERQREYFEWAKQVVDGLPAPNAILKAEFDRTYARSGELGS